MKKFHIIIRDTDIFFNKEIFNTCGQAEFVDLPICLRIESVFFPHEDWTDMAYPIIYNWAETLLSHKWARTARYYLYFMDGPYYIDVRQNELNLKISGVENRYHKETIFEYECTYMEFLSELLFASKKLNHFFRSNMGFNQGFEAIINSSSCYESRLKAELLSLNKLDKTSGKKNTDKTIE